jgi:outer membrane protein
MEGTIMKRALSAGAMLLSLLVGLAPLAAEEALTLAETRTLALGRSTTLQSALLSVDAALIDEKLQAFTWLPSLSASASASASIPSATFEDAVGASLGLSVKQTVFDGTASILAAIDGLSTSIARAESRAEYFSVLEAADAAFYDAAEASASAEAARSDLDNALNGQALAKAKLDAGMISPVAYLEQEATVAAKRTSLVQAQGRLSVALRTLASLTGRSLPLSIEGIDTAYYDTLMERFAGFSDAEMQSFMDKIQKAAAKNNSALTSADLASMKAEKAVRLAKAAYLPSVSASWSSSLGVSAAGAEMGSSLGISASIPLDLWNTKAAVDSKTVAAKQAALALDETRRTTTLEIEGAVYDGVSSAKAVGSSKKALEYAERYYQNVLEQYRLSAASASDLSGAALLVSTNRSSLITARYEFLANLSSLRTLAGLESEDLLLQLVP